MQSKTLFILIAGLLVAGAAFAQSASAPPGLAMAGNAPERQHLPEQRFAKLDTNGDQAISREEAHSRVDKRFDRTDANQDGKLTKDEMQSHRRSRHERHNARFEHRFKAADKDRDGALTRAEAEAGQVGKLAKHFEHSDLNKDGKVTPEELHTAIRNNKGRHLPVSRLPL